MNTAEIKKGLIQDAVRKVNSSLEDYDYTLEFKDGYVGDVGFFVRPLDLVGLSKAAREKEIIRWERQYAEWLYTNCINSNITDKVLEGSVARRKFMDILVNSLLEYDKVENQYYMGFSPGLLQRSGTIDKKDTRMKNEKNVGVEFSLASLEKQKIFSEFNTIAMELFSVETVLKNYGWVKNTLLLKDIKNINSEFEKIFAGAPNFFSQTALTEAEMLEAAIMAARRRVSVWNIQGLDERLKAKVKDEYKTKGITKPILFKAELGLQL